MKPHVLWIFLLLAVPGCGGCSAFETDDAVIRSEVIETFLTAFEAQMNPASPVGDLGALLTAEELSEVLEIMEELRTLSEAQETVPAQGLVAPVTRLRFLHSEMLSRSHLPAAEKEFLGALSATFLDAVLVAAGA
jgi:hypothetical protein